MNVQPNYDPSRFSYYVTDAFYSELVDDFSDGKLRTGQSQMLQSAIAFDT